MVRFALLLPRDEAVGSWLRLVNSKLSTPDWVRGPFSGRIRELRGGLWVFDVEPLYPPGVLLVVVGLLIAAGVGCWVVGLEWLGGVVIVVGAVAWVVTSAFYASGVYRLLVFVQCWRLTGVMSWPRDGVGELLRRLSRGKV